MHNMTKAFSRFGFLLFLFQTSAPSVAAFKENETAKQLRRRNEAKMESDTTRRVFVKYKNEKHDGFVRSIQLHQSKDTLEINFDFPSLNSVALTATEAEIKKLEADPNVESILDDPKRYSTHFTPSARKTLNRRKLVQDKVSEGEQTIPYGIELVQAPFAWQVGATGKGVKVCVIDSGFDSSHEDFTSSEFTGASLSSGEAWTQDGSGHGTHVIGTIAASNNGIGVVGVAPEAEIVIMKVSDEESCLRQAI